MASKSNIEWTDASWNPVVGCTKISPGCLNCYAERMANRIAGKELSYFMKNPSLPGSVTRYKYMNVIENGKWNGKIHCDGLSLEIPLHWRQPRMIFVCSMGDLFHKSVPFEFIDRVVDVFNKCPQHTGQLLTKRAERLHEYAKYRNFEWPDNTIGMVTAENQQMADLRIPHLLQCGFKTTGVSIEPMLGAIDIKKYAWVRQQCSGEKGCGFTGASYEFDHPKKEGAFRCPKCGKNHTYLITDWLDWVIVGGESGPGARPMHPDWARGIRDQCVAAGVPFFFKGWGEWGIAETRICPEWRGLSLAHESVLLKGSTPFKCFPENKNATIPLVGWVRVGKKKAGRLLDGLEWSEYPKGGVK